MKIIANPASAEDYERLRESVEPEEIKAAASALSATFAVSVAVASDAYACESVEMLGIASYQAVAMQPSTEDPACSELSSKASQICEIKARVCLRAKAPTASCTR